MFIALISHLRILFQVEERVLSNLDAMSFVIDVIYRH
jgi:hypothetical protein